MNKRVLIIGGAGYIGGYTTDILLNNGYEVTVFDKLIYENRFFKEVQFIYGDVRDTDHVEKVAKDFDVVILMAALVGDPACSVEPELTEEINHQAIKRICNVLNDQHIIFMSTCSVYGAQLETLNEDSKTDPLSSYALTKLASEKYVNEKNGTIFRLGTVYGVGDTYSRIRLDLVVNVLTMKAIYDGRFNIFGGEQWRPLICVKDISGYIEEAIRKDIRGTYILSEGNYTMKMLGEKIKEILPDVKVDYTDISFQDARNYNVDNTKCNIKFKYKPKSSIESEVDDMVKIFKENRICDVSDDTYHNGQFIKNNLKNI